MSIEDTALTFTCHQEWLYGILSLPASVCKRGVLIVVGGPQYRVGSHRQFALLARFLAANGIAVMRFDYRGMGDSEGETRSFDLIQDDLRAAIDAFMAAVPGMREVVLWGLCDAASAATLYAPTDARVSGLVLLNPWVRTAEGIAKTTLKHYYLDRLGNPDFWRQIAGRRFDYVRSLKSMVGLVRTAFGSAASADHGNAALPERMYASMRVFTGPVMLVIGGADLTGREFCDMASATSRWKRLLNSPRVTQRRIDKADHTFSRRVWRDQVADWTREWLGSW